MAALGLQTAPDIRKARRLVVKIGSALLVDRVTGLKTAWLTALALDVAEAKARELGFTVLAGSIDKPHGLRECVILDDDGYAWVPAVAIAR